MFIDQRSYFPPLGVVLIVRAVSQLRTLPQLRSVTDLKTQ